jgi:hypothetical protein
VSLSPGKLPANTSIKHLISPGQYGALTGGAKKLTKGDLAHLAQWGMSGGKSGSPPQHLTIADLMSLHKAMPSPPGAKPKDLVPHPDPKVASAAGDSYCCCCTPCCCCTAAAEIAPVRHLLSSR